MIATTPRHSRFATVPVLLLGLFLGFAGLMATPAADASAATFVLDSVLDAVDSSPGDGFCLTAAGECTLRAAIQEANALPGRDRIEDGTATTSPFFVLTIPGASEDAGATGDLDITDDLDLDLDGDPTRPTLWLSRIDAASLDRAIDVISGSVTLNGVEVVGGSAPPGENGGALRNAGALTASSVYLTGGVAPSGDGGNVFNSGSMSMISGGIDDGAAPAGRGGGVANSGALELTGGGVRRGTALAGGGIFNAGLLGASRTPIAQCQATAGGGGGLWNEPAATAGLSDLSLGGNSAASGAGGLDNLGTAELHNVTEGENGALGVRNDDAGGATTTIENTILAGACAGTIGSGGYNITASCSLTSDLTGDQIGVEPRISALFCDYSDYYTKTSCPYFLPERGSPAIEAGDPAGCFDHRGVKINRDQRYVSYPLGRTCDVGSGIYVAACENGRPLDEARLVVSGLGRGPGRQSVRLGAQIPLNPVERLLPPPFYGAQILIEDLGSGASWVDRWHQTDPILPGYNHSACIENRRTRENTYSYREKSLPWCTPRADGRIMLFQTIDWLDDPAKDRVDVKLRTQKATVAEPVGPIQVSITFGFSAVHSANGRNGTCAKQVLDLGRCERSGSSLTCQLP